MMSKSGNSSTGERIDLMNRDITLFGIETIECLLADREFIGEHWIVYLTKIKFDITYESGKFLGYNSKKRAPG